MHNNFNEKIRKAYLCNDAHSIENKLFKVCSPKVWRQDAGFLIFFEKMQDPTRTKKITIPKRLILSQLLRESSFSRDPMVDNRKKASHSEEKITVLIRSNFVLTKEERKRHNGKFPQWGSERFQTVMSNIVQRRLKTSQSIESLVIEGENVFKDAYWLRNESVFFHSLGCARAVYMGLVSYFGEKPPHASTSFVRGRVSAITTSRSYPILSLITHFLRKLPKDMIEKDLVKFTKPFR